MYYRITLLLILVLSFAGTSTAQDESELSCTTEEYQESIQILIDIMTEFKPQIVVENDAIELLISLDAAIDTIRAGCTGGSFTVADYPNGIIGPILFNGTLYQAELIAEGGNAALSSVVIDGDCGFGSPFIGTAFEGGSETDLWEFGGDCTLMFEINGSGDWTLNIEKLR